MPCIFRITWQSESDWYMRFGWQYGNSSFFVDRISNIMGIFVCILMCLICVSVYVIDISNLSFCYIRIVCHRVFIAAVITLPEWVIGCQDYLLLDWLCIFGLKFSVKYIYFYYDVFLYNLLTSLFLYNWYMLSLIKFKNVNLLYLYVNYLYACYFSAITASWLDFMR